MFENTSECQFHNNCGGYCETQAELESNLCEDCLEAEREQDRFREALKQVKYDAEQALATLSQAKCMDGLDINAEEMLKNLAQKIVNLD